MKKLQVFDEVSKDTLEFEVEDEEFDRIVKGDVNLAQKLTRRFQEQQNFISAFNLIRQSPDKVYTSDGQCNSFEVENILENQLESQSVYSPCNEEDLEQTQNENLEGRDSDSSHNTIRVWTRERTLLLISLLKKYDKEFNTTLKKTLWKKISDEMSRETGLVVSPQQCDTKWKGLKNTYKNIKKHNSTSGNEPKFWEFFDLLDEILHEKPEINPVAVCSTRDGLVTNRSNDAEVTIVTTPKHAAAEESPACSVLKRKRSIENSTERRHRERMERQDRFLSLFERLTRAIENNNQ